MDFSQYLITLPADQLTRLYDSPWTCQAVLRSLPPLSQHFILRLLFIPSPVPADWITASVQADAERERDRSLQLLSQLHVLRSHKAASGAKTIRLDATFQARLQQSVLNPASLGSVGTVQPNGSSQAANGAQAAGAVTQNNRTEACTSVADINAFGQAQWQAVLLALVDGRRSSLRVHANLKPLDVRALFHSSGLTDEATELTDAGFKFLFLDVYSQLWQLLQQYLKASATGTGHSLADALSFLLQLSFRKVRYAALV